ncbi:MAG: 30S ribosomal protein S26e [Candidatus Fermentimicrarchaeum limneticum]|uniref:30S ribosomal protein S26e n=1 Tax=Fermentimicrarchaeum limneticum TaxID=2795018 RepID=A0A7D6BSH0_FERL1|nr:MAG: 30S ribosomal protein S26e [Candidatus Fermentimicrarchaeum limneticum]
MRGRDHMVICVACGRRLPRGKAVTYERSIIFSTDLKTADDVKLIERRKSYYCPSCGKSLGIYEKKKRRAMAKYNR